MSREKVLLYFSEGAGLDLDVEQLIDLDDVEDVLFVFLQFDEHDLQDLELLVVGVVLDEFTK
jgi:hypothetical protein